MKSIQFVLFAAVLLSACASTPSAPTPIGQGVYMLSGRDATVFGSYEQKVAELVGQANAFCAQQNKAATLTDASGRSSIVGTPGVRAGQTASAMITFRCE
jgi:hypothetical protein